MTPKAFADFSPFRRGTEFFWELKLSPFFQKKKLNGGELKRIESIFWGDFIGYIIHWREKKEVFIWIFNDIDFPHGWLWKDGCSFERQPIWIKNRDKQHPCFFFWIHSESAGENLDPDFCFWVPKERSLNMCNWTTLKKPVYFQEEMKVIRKTWVQFFFGPWGEVYLYFRLLLTVEDLPPTWIAGFIGWWNSTQNPAAVRIPPTWGYHVFSPDHFSRSPSARDFRHCSN